MLFDDPALAFTEMIPVMQTMGGKKKDKEKGRGKMEGRKAEERRKERLQIKKEKAKIKQQSAKPAACRYKIERASLATN